MSTNINRSTIKKIALVLLQSRIPSSRSSAALLPVKPARYRMFGRLVTSRASQPAAETRKEHGDVYRLCKGISHHDMNHESMSSHSLKSFIGNALLSSLFNWWSAQGNWTPGSMEKLPEQSNKSSCT